jgi:hypothetical protein
MKRHANKRPLALLAASALVSAFLALSSSTQQAQARQSGSSDKPQSSAASSSAPAAAKPTPEAAASPYTNSAPPAQASASQAKPQRPSANGAGVVWINTDTGMYHKQGTRLYGKTRHGKYMLEADAIKAGYKPSK